MPIKSYLAYAQPGQLAALRQELGGLRQCSVRTAGDHDLAVVVTDTPSEASDEQLLHRIESLPSLRGLSLVAAFAADDDLVGIQGVNA